MRVFNKSGTVIAAQWSNDAATWVEIGEVTGSGSSDGGEVHGVVYDHVMPVEIDTATGVVTLQLGYNELENPFISAQRFIDQNQLDQNYLSQIADFITARAGKPSAPTFDMSDPSSSSSSSSSGGNHPMDVVEDSSSKRPRHNYTLLPLQAYFSYEDIPSGLRTKFMAKIRDFNTAFAAGGEGGEGGGGDGRGVLTETDLGVLEDCLGVLADTSHYHSSRLPKNTIAVLHTMLTHWTQEQGRTLFPSFDLLRMVCAHPSGSQQLAASPYLSAVLARTLRVVLQDFRSGAGAADDPSSLSASCRPASSPQALTALRFLATSCRHSPLRQKVLGLLLASPPPSSSSSSSQSQSESEEAFSSFSSLIGSLSALSSSSAIKSIHRHALASWCANVILACCVGEGSGGAGAEAEAVLRVYYPGVVWLLQQELDNAEVVVRSLLAVGTVAVALDSNSNTSVSEALKSDLQSGALVESVLTAVQDRWSGKKSDYMDLCLVEVAGAVYNQ